MPLVPLPNRMSLAVKMDWPVPPFCTGRTPETCDPKATEELYSCPDAVDWTMPPEFNEVMVVLPLVPTVNTALLVEVAKRNNGVVLPL